MRELSTAESPGFHQEFINLMARITHNGHFPAGEAPEEMLDLARSAAEEYGRDPDAIEDFVST